jgi:hypothetical protein
LSGAKGTPAQALANSPIGTARLFTSSTAICSHPDAETSDAAAPAAPKSSE